MLLVNLRPSEIPAPKRSNDEEIRMNKSQVAAATTVYPKVVEVFSAEVCSAGAEASDCIACSGTTDASFRGLFDTRFGVEGRFDARRCRQCGLEQLYPLPSAAQLKGLYERYYNFSGEHGTAYTTLRDWFFSSPLYRLWIRLDEDISFHTRRGNGRLLDVGCNEGRTLKNYARNGYQAEGTELNEKAAALARSAGFRVFTGPLEDYSPSAPYDVAVCSNVLEHALDPGAMLASVRRLLKADGQVWISCPNSQSWLRSVFGRWWINWHVPFHISHFSSVALQDVLQKAASASSRCGRSPRRCGSLLHS
jgi:SAM-dependent methyltransferase